MSKIGNTIKENAVILSQPRITEKATMLSGNPAPVYVFEVAASANKTAVKEAVKGLYKVDAVKVNIVHLPAKTVYRRGKKGTKPGVKKAMVFLKSGDRIEII